MVANADQMNERIVANLHALEAELDDLPNVVQAWPDLSRDTQVDIQYDWQEVLGATARELCRLRPCMTIDQARRYQILCYRLDAAQSSFERIGITWRLSADDAVPTVMPVRGAGPGARTPVK